MLIHLGLVLLVSKPLVQFLLLHIRVVQRVKTTPNVVTSCCMVAVGIMLSMLMLMRLMSAFPDLINFDEET